MKPPVNRDRTPDAVARRLLIMFDMHEEGTQMLRLRLQRQYPDADAADIGRHVAQMLRSYRDDGDPYLRPSTCPRFSPQS